MAILKLGEVDMPAQTEERPTGEGGQIHLAKKADVAEARVEIAKSEARTERWIVASVSLGVAVMTIMYRLLG